MFGKGGLRKMVKAYWNVEQRTGSSGSLSIAVDVIVTLYHSHVIQTLDVFVVKLVKFFFWFAAK